MWKVVASSKETLGCRIKSVTWPWCKIDRRHTPYTLIHAKSHTNTHLSFANIQRVKKQRRKKKYFTFWRSELFSLFNDIFQLLYSFLIFLFQLIRFVQVFFLCKWLKNIRSCLFYLFEYGVCIVVLKVIKYIRRSSILLNRVHLLPCCYLNGELKAWLQGTKRSQFSALHIYIKLDFECLKLTSLPAKKISFSFIVRYNIIHFFVLQYDYWI